MYHIRPTEEDAQELAQLLECVNVFNHDSATPSLSAVVEEPAYSNLENAPNPFITFSQMFASFVAEHQLPKTQMMGFIRELQRFVISQSRHEM